MISTIPTFSRRVKTDNFVFRLHYRWTVFLLVSCSFAVTCRILLGHSFSCQQVPGLPQAHLETKCYSDGVYSLPVQLIGSGQRSSSLQNSSQRPSSHQTRIHGYRRYQHFYQWVNLMFLVQAALFYLPHLAWKSYESGRLDRLTRGLDKDDGTELCYLAKYVLATQGKNKVYAGMHIFCEFLNYLVCLSQTLCLVHFFEVTGVPDYLPFRINTWSEFQKFYFPMSGTCSMTHHDKVLNHHETTCLLPLNHLYMYMFLWVHAWYVCLTVLSGVVLVFRLVMLGPSQREAVVKLSCPWSENTDLASLVRRLSYADWFFLTRFQKAMSDVDFARLLDKIAVVSACNTCDVLRQDSLSSVDGKKDLESLAEESPV